MFIQKYINKSSCSLGLPYCVWVCFNDEKAGCRGPEVRNWTADRWVVGSNPGLCLGRLSSRIVHVPTTGWPSLA